MFVQRQLLLYSALWEGMRMVYKRVLHIFMQCTCLSARVGEEKQLSASPIIRPSSPLTPPRLPTPLPASALDSISAHALHQSDPFAWRDISAQSAIFQHRSDPVRNRRIDQICQLSSLTVSRCGSIGASCRR